MRITLDYYRILSVPIKATQEQIDKSFADRCHQEPRREYSEFAIASRQKLLQQAHQVLSDESQRADYDAKFFNAIAESNGELKEIPETASEEELPTEKVSPQVQLSTIPDETTEPITPSIEISHDLFAGALLIYYELAEYELILRLGVDYLNNTIYANFANSPENTVEEVTEESTTNDPIKEDVILSVVLSYLELSREQWRRNKYENAAISGQMGINLLETEQLFPTLKAEIEMDVHKLKPYRILELLANSPSNSPERLRGLQLLQEMIRQRQGIEGRENDYSGLTVEEFLHFIQQLRNYLTAKEQQKLFVAEAKKGSGVAGFLAVYALIARGYSQQKPQLILEAQQLFHLLSKTQDISWEQSICYLLLGQTEQAIAAIKKSPELQIVTAIKEHSQDDSDLLPGICFCGEKWLREDVLSQFWDLKDHPITLDEYFSDPKVQDYLEQLSPIAPVEVNTPQQLPQTKEKTKQRRSFFPWGRQKRPSEKSQIQAATGPSEISQVSNASATATLERQPQNNLDPAVASVSRNSNMSVNSKVTDSQTRSNNNSHKHISPPRRPSNRSQTRYKSPLWLIYLKSAMLLSGLIFSLGALGFFITQQTINRDSQKIAETAPNVEPTKAEIPEPTKLPVSQPNPEPVKPALPSFDNASAQQVIQQWLDSKSAALGKSHQIDKLNSILAPELLNSWSNTARYYQQTNIYRNYQHKLKITSVVFDPQKPNVATVDAEVQEIAQHYQSSKLNSAQSYDDNLLVRYQLIKQGNSWLIQTSQVLKTL
ncbi:MAG: IMS domain-containing protein [Cyanobacteria bacterium P01_F01_bin.143]